MSDINIMMDVPVTVTIEFGRTMFNIKEILDFCPGMVIILDKAASAPLDMLVNGRLIAHGKVVMVNDNFGVRIIDIQTRDLLNR